MSRKLANVVAWVNSIWSGFQLSVVVMMVVGAVGLPKTIHHDQLRSLWVGIGAAAIINILSLISSLCLTLACFDQYLVNTRIRLLDFWVAMSILNILFSFSHLIVVSDTVGGQVGCILNLGLFIIAGMIVINYRLNLAKFVSQYQIYYKKSHNRESTTISTNHDIVAHV